MGLGLTPGFQSPPGEKNIFRIGDPEIKLHFHWHPGRGDNPRLKSDSWLMLVDNCKFIIFIYIYILYMGVSKNRGKKPKMDGL